MRLILISSFLLMTMVSFGQQQQTFEKKAEKARAEELRLGAMSKRFVCTLKEGTVSNSLFSSISQVMEEKDGYISVEVLENKMVIITSDFITLTDVEDVMNQFGETFAVDSPKEHSLVKR